MTIPIFVGYDDREAIGYSVFCHSVLARTKAGVAFYPVRGKSVVGATQFNAGRFGIPAAMGYRGWAIWAECDMLCRADIEELWDYRHPSCDVVVAKHAYKTKHQTKFLGQPNEDYPRKNWTSLMLVNCDAAVWRRVEALQPSLSDLHRLAESAVDKPTGQSVSLFSHDRIGSLPLEWNWLVGEYEHNLAAKIAHFTIGLPCWEEYALCDYSNEWRTQLALMTHHEAKAA